MAAVGETARDPRQSPLHVFRVFLGLGLTSFGGPVAHLGYFRTAFVERRGWLSDRAYADLVALCQFMPGPASSQVGIAIGLMRAGYAGALAAWTGFTLPSALALVLFAYGLEAIDPDSAWLHGLKIVAVAVVAQALLGMARSLCPDRERATLAAAAAALALTVTGVPGQLAAIALGAVAGLAVLGRQAEAAAAGDGIAVSVSRRTGAMALVLFFAVLAALPVLAALVDSRALAYVDSFFRSGALVFGGGHVVLPLLQAEVVGPGWVTATDFLAGYGAAQAVPGPLFTFAAFLGAVMMAPPSGAVGAVLCLLAVFLPSAFLVVGLLPFWRDLSRNPWARRGLTGINAAVVGLLAAALYDPVFTSAIRDGGDLALALAAFAALAWWRVPPWAVVAGTALAGIAVAAAS